jgi:hypothetical protein
MKNLLLILISISFSLSTNFSQAQIYNMSNTTVNTCSGTFYDPQGTGDYVSGQALIEMTFCSSVPTDEIILDFSGFGFQVETNFDFLNIYDGVGTGGAVLWDSQASGGAVNPGVITSTTGCVTVTWSTDGSVTYEGWGAAISCSTPTCTDGVQNGTETLIDCGGASCPPCTDILISDGGTINACSGYFYDAGGTGNYDFNENYVTTICSGTGDEVTMDFSNFAFGLQANNDVLYIYDGTGTGGTPIWESITGNGLVNPGAITSTTGCLTFEFISDGVTNNIGWVGELSCPSCTDGIQNGNETGVDCGGPTCVACPNCFNGIQDGNETGIDCGPSCAQPCHCSDGILNFDEEDIDCGGSCLPCPEPCSLDLSWVVDGTGSVTYPGGTAYTMSTGTINTCGGTFYDPGGSGGSYGNNDVNTMTFCTDNPDPNAQIVFDFTLWDLETCCDYLTIYDGPDNSSPQIYYGDGGDPTPGYVQSTNGCLTFFWDSDGSVVDIGWAANIGCYIPPVFDCNGGDILLTANGQGEYYEAMNNNFDFGQAGSGWSSNITADFTNPCDPSIDGGTYMWMGNSAPHPREIETAPLDLSCGGEICFFLDFATQGNASPCEGIDLPGEGVFLEFSTDGGTTWNTIEYFGPAGVGNNVDNGGTDPQMTAWNQYCYDIPAAAMTPNTIIHWAQTGSSGINNDHWGLDNVTISSLVSCDPYVYDYWQVPGPDNNPVQTETLTTTTTYTVTYSNGVDACTTSVTVPVPPGTTADAGPDYTICPGAAPVTYLQQRQLNTFYL